MRNSVNSATLGEETNLIETSKGESVVPLAPLSLKVTVVPPPLLASRTMTSPFCGLLVSNT